MRGLTRGQLFELAFWMLFAIGAFALSFQFSKDIEIYEFGASGWPRVIIGLIVLAVLGQLLHDLRERNATKDAEATQDSAPQQQSLGTYLRVGGTLLLPVIFALALQPIGFYTLTPLFIVGMMLLAGERRIKLIVGVTLGLYAAFLLLFAKLLYVGLPTGTMSPFYDFSNWLLVLLR